MNNFGIGNKIKLIGISGTIISLLFCINPSFCPIMLLVSSGFFGFTLSGLLISKIENEGQIELFFGYHAKIT